jgi:hypothetical protein
MDDPFLGSLAVLAGVPAYAWAVRGRGYATFGFVILAIALAGAVALHQRLATWAPPDARPWIDVAFVYGAVAGGAHLAHLVRARLRSSLFRGLVSIPGMVFIAVGALSGLWLLALLPVRGVLWLGGWTGGLAALRGSICCRSRSASCRWERRSGRRRRSCASRSATPTEDVTRMPVERSPSRPGSARSAAADRRDR